MRHATPSRSRNQRGQTIILMTLAIMMLFGMLGLVVDIGWAYFRKQAAQAAADAAAQAAGLAAYAAASGSAMTCGTTGISCSTAWLDCPSVITTASNNLLKGCLYAQANGFTTGPNVTVSLQSGTGNPPTASGVTVSYWVVAKVVERQAQLFSAVLGNRNATVAARATTGVREASNGGCVFTLNPAASGSLTVNGTTMLQSGCGVFVNSNAADAINAVGGGTIMTTGAARTQIVGNWSGSGIITPAPQVGMPTTTDPFGDMQPPTVGSCTSSGVSLGSHDTMTIDPGVICGPVYLGAQSHLTMNPGLYVVTGGISLGAQTILTAHGVTIYMPTGGINMAGGATADLTAPTSGIWQGILIYQARGNTSESVMVGGTSQAMNGVLYFPSAHLTYTGGSSTDATATTIVADTLSMVGNSYISAAATTQYTGVTGGVFLVE